MRVSTSCGNSPQQQPPSDAAAEQGVDLPRREQSSDRSGREQSPDRTVRDQSSDGPAALRALALSGCGNLLTAKITIGGSQVFDVAIDTGSSTLAVAGATCAACSKLGLSPLYRPGATAVDRKQTASANYASIPPVGWSGEIYRDTVLANGLGKTVSVNLVDITSETNFFEMNQCGTNPAQGILGLGQTEAAFAGTSSYLDELTAAGVPNVFAIHMCPSGGHLWLGGYDPSFGTSPPQFTPMGSSTFYYTVVLNEVQVGGLGLGLQPSDFGVALVDSGSTNFMLPAKAFAAVKAELAKNELFVQTFGAPDSFLTSGGNCQLAPQSKAELDTRLPALTLVFGSSPAVTIQTPATESYLSVLQQGATTYYCPALIQTPSGYPGMPPVDLGAPILNGKVTVYDRANKRIGFASAPCK